MVLWSGIFSSCVPSFFFKGPTYDTRKITFQNLSLFNQREAPGQHPHWKGNWIFRRERLASVDQTLRAAKPDILILQEVMAKQDSPYDSDQYILGAGALLGYDWQSVQTETYRDTHEVESLSVVSGLPVYKDPYEDERKRMWPLGHGSFLAAFIVTMENQEIAIFNLKISEQVAGQGIWYQYVVDRVKEYISRYKLCNKRIVIAGNFESPVNQPDYQTMLEHLQLSDSSLGFCEQESNCYTQTTENPIFQLTRGDARPGRVSRILTHKSSLVYSSTRNFNSFNWQQEFKQLFAERKVNPTQNYGWISSIRFDRCQDSENL
ncbi:MAG: endonuclease/exonuclease/phosphatase family protein [Oligoflexales bacterium]|nr:endonuclease/exonuclease/phosphatase family protein [Oligoflexales bacterium]